MRSAIAVGREYRRVERAWRLLRRRSLRNVVFRRDETRLEAARQALAWVMGAPAMSMSKIHRINERDFRKRTRAFQRQVRADRSQQP